MRKNIEFVVKKKWIDSDEFMDVVTIAESTPRPIAINCSTFIGYKRKGVIGAICATLGVAAPSIIIISIIAAFISNFADLEIVKNAFKHFV